MKIVMFSTRPYDRDYFQAAGEKFRHELFFLEAALTEKTAALADGYDAVCIFVNDKVDARTAARLSAGGIRFIALRCAGYNNVDLQACAEHGLRIVRVPAYSPHAVAEHTVALVLALNRKIHRAYSRVRDGNFSLNGLLGFDMYGKTVGVIGTGAIGRVFAKIMHGFGCRILAFDKVPDPACEAFLSYVTADQLFAESDVISLHCPLTPETHHLIDAAAIEKMKKGVMIVNTSRGGVIDTKAAIAGLKCGQIGYLGLDVYEEEDQVFFHDLSIEGIPDDTLARLLTFPNVIVTGHQAFFTHEALQTIAQTTLQNLSDLETTGSCKNELRPPD